MTMTDDTTRPIDGEVMDRQADQPMDIRQEVQEARALIPVGITGATPMNFAQQVDFAKTMCQAKVSLPAHLRGNGGDCLAIIDIASRVGLSPYMVANQTYVGPDGRLSFMSQLFHALAQASGLMRGDFSVKYEGEGDDLVCIVSAHIKGDPEVKVHRSPPLKQVHPGYSYKTESGGVKSVKTLSYIEGKKLKADAEGGFVQGLFSKGSPLWDKKERVQLFYDTSRDFVRIFMPRATLGVYTPEEMEETPINQAPAESTAPALTERLSTADRTEGHKPGAAAAELANVAANKEVTPQKAEPPKDDDTKAADPKAAKAKDTKKATPAKGKKSEPEPERARDLIPKGAHPPKETVQAIADKAEAQANAKRAADAAQADKDKAQALADAKERENAAKKGEPPTTAEEYIVYARNWLENATDRDNAEARWDGERELRISLKVLVKDANALIDFAEKKFGEAR